MTVPKVAVSHMIRDWASHNILMRDLVFCKRLTRYLPIRFPINIEPSDLEGYYASKIFMHSDSHPNSCRVQVFFVTK